MRESIEDAKEFEHPGSDRSPRDPAVRGTSTKKLFPSRAMA